MRHEEIQRIYKNHYFLSMKDMGGVRELVGYVDVIVFFVSDSQSSWTESAKKKYRETHYDAMQYIQNTARQKGVSLQIRNAYVDAALSILCSFSSSLCTTYTRTAGFRVSESTHFPSRRDTKSVCSVGISKCLFLHRTTPLSHPRSQKV